MLSLKDDGCLFGFMAEEANLERKESGSYIQFFKESEYVVLIK